MTVTGEDLLLGAETDEEIEGNGAIYAIVYAAEVYVNGDRQRVCMPDGIPQEEQESFWIFYSATITAPCFDYMNGETYERLFSNTQFKIWLPDHFDTTAPGTVRIWKTPEYAFNADAAPTPTETTQPLAPVSTTVPVAAALRTATLEVSGGECANIDTPSTQLLAPDTVTAPADTTILGGVSFELTCSEVGGSTTVSLRLDTEYSDTSVLSAYKDLTGNGTLVPADVTFVNRNGATYVEFPLTDGLTNTDSNLVDEDGVADGRIVDPLYIGILASATGVGEGDGDSSVVPGGASAGSMTPGAPNSGFGAVVDEVTSRVATASWVAVLIVLGSIAMATGVSIARRARTSQ